MKKIKEKDLKQAQKEREQAEAMTKENEALKAKVEAQEQALFDLAEVITMMGGI